VRPGDDFYRYVNAGWLTTATAPPGLPAIDSFVEVYLSTEQRVAGIVAQARETTGAPGSPEQLIGDFHRSHANRARRDALGITPIASTLSIIAGTTDKRELARIMASPWIDGFFPAGPMTDAAVPTRQIAALGVGGLTMPSRDYYLTEAEPYIGHQGPARLYRREFSPRRICRCRCPRQQGAGAGNRDRQAALDRGAAP
jgi:endothelin-converting enzyme/putative endopeptidase